MQFVYTAKSKTGDIQTGHISAADVEAVKRALREQSLFAIDIRKKVANSPFKAILGWRDKTALSRRDLLSVTTQLAIMTRSGGDLASAFLSLSQQCSNPTMRNILGQIHKDVAGGKSISDAMQAQAAVFGDAYVASVAAGEAAGKVPEVLGRLSQFQRSGMRGRGTVRALLPYPLLLSGVSGLVVIGLVTFVLPKFVDIFGQFEVSLPMITRVIVAISDVMRKHVFIWVPIFIAAIVGLIVSRRVESGRKKWDYALLNTPILRDITRAFYIGRTFRLMGLMIESGVPLLEGLRLTRNSVRNSLYRRLFVEIADAILKRQALVA